MTVLERIQKIGEIWFLTEPLLFAVYCSHNMVENKAMDVPMRTGGKKIEFSPYLLASVSDTILAELLKIELFRILLKHPYQRQPPFADKALLTRASNVTITDVYDVPHLIEKQMSGAELDLPHGLCFEEYYQLIKTLVVNATPLSGNEEGEGSGQGEGQDSEEDGDGQGEGQSAEGDGGMQGESQGSEDDGNGQGREQGSNGDENKGRKQKASRDAQMSELWEEDQEACCNINDIIEVTMASDTWGTVPGSMQGLIKASLKVEMDYRRMLSIFKASVLSSKRHLTRMRPNRRFGFDAMGSRYDLKANLLVAVDVSGSVTDKSLGHFFSVIGRLFKYGVEKLDIIQFDTDIKGDPEEFKKARKTVKIMGRGGTDFQPVANFYCEHPEYDGLIFFTDGFADTPTYKTKRPIDVLWVLCSKSAYESNCEWIKNLKRNRVTYIPRSE
jgi:predicted metal-dependent peptidase